MSFLGASVIILALASGANGCECGDWASIVRKTEALIVHREPFLVPLDPVGSKYEAACVRVSFKIDQDGLPQALQIEKSSRNRVIDVAARETVRHFRFEASPDNEGKIFALVFDYVGSSP